MENHTPQLMVVGLPIGNPGDLTPRARLILESSDLILCEDTRKFKDLAGRWNLNFRGTLKSYYDQTEKLKAPMIVDSILKEGIKAALVCDAGTPGINDPGCMLVAEAHHKNLAVTPISGASALSCFISICGLPSHGFAFKGFFPRKTGKKLDSLIKDIQFTDMTYVFFESPRRIQATLQSLTKHLPHARVCVAKELTKTYETIWSGTCEETCQKIQKIKEIKGEFVFGIYGFESVKDEHSFILKQDELDSILFLLQGKDMSTGDRAKLAKKLGFKKQDIYKAEEQ